MKHAPINEEFGSPEVSCFSLLLCLPDVCITVLTHPYYCSILGKTKWNFPYLPQMSTLMHLFSLF